MFEIGMFSLASCLFGVLGFLGILTLFLPGFVHCLLKPQDLRKKYNAEWAIVTGGSSGIGKSIVERLCQQGINVIIVAFPEKMLDETTEEMTHRFPKVKVVKVGMDLSRKGFMEAIDKETRDKDVQLLFCNAGFMITGFFADTHINKTKANSSVNVDSHLELTHEYVNRMLASKKKGAVFFTSSPAWMLPSPTAAMYAGTKAFITHFGVSLAAELKSEGIDVCVVHPSPVQSNFYNEAGDGAEVNFFKSTAKGPELLVGTMFACVGRLVLCNQGYFPKAMGVLHKILDFSALVEITANVAHTSATFISVKKAAMDATKKK
mmetsp:Transcript_31396/g.46300  ORF Transcript_31396/g.46300 Transcript_31396/m.46300 type:complete len:320 (-) Transcript_31396:310-1269(-)